MTRPTVERTEADMNEQATQADLEELDRRCNLVETLFMWVDKDQVLCLLATITALRAQVAALGERVAAQAELLGKRAEKPADVCKACGGNGCIVFQLGTATCGACNGTGKETTTEELSDG